MRYVLDMTKEEYAVYKVAVNESIGTVERLLKHSDKNNIALRHELSLLKKLESKKAEVISV